jgi:hypothetical protein
VAKHQQKHSHAQRSKYCTKLKEIKIGISVENLWKFILSPLRTRYRPYKSNGREWFSVPLQLNTYSSIPLVQDAGFHRSCVAAQECLLAKQNTAYFTQLIWRGNMVLSLVTWGTRTTGRSSHQRVQYCIIQYVCAPSYKVQLAGKQIQWHLHKVEAYVSSVMRAGKCCLWLIFLFWQGGGATTDKMLLVCCLITKTSHAIIPASLGL